MAIIHCGFVLHQNKSINQRMIPKRNHSRDRCASFKTNLKRQ